MKKELDFKNSSVFLSTFDCPMAAPPGASTPALTAVTETSLVGPGALDITARLKKVLSIGRFEADKIDVEIDIEPGGGAANIAFAFESAGGKYPRLGVITGADPLGNLLTRMLCSCRSNVRRIATGDRTRVSLLTPRDGRSRETRTWTERSGLDEAATFGHIHTWFGADRRIVLASMTAVQAGLVEKVLDTHAGQTVMMVTRSQCEDCNRTLAQATRCALIQLNCSELETLTAIRGDIVRGINCLREKSIRSVIVTAGLRGIFAYLDWAGGWLHVPAFNVMPGGSTSKCGDIVLGTFLAGIDRGESAKESLRIAAAAAAMNAASLPRAGGWQELVDFAQRTPTVPLASDNRSGPRLIMQQASRTVRRFAAPTGYMTAGAIAVLTALRILDFMP